MSDPLNDEIRNACNIIIEQGNLNTEEKQFMERCAKDSNPRLFIENNCEDPIFLSLSIKLAKVLGEEEKKK